MSLLPMNPVTRPKTIQPMNANAEFSRRSEIKRLRLAISMIDISSAPSAWAISMGLARIAGRFKLDLTPDELRSRYDLNSDWSVRQHTKARRAWDTAAALSNHARI